MPTLSNWLNKDKVQYVKSVADWKEAIQIAARPLLAEGAISPAYVESIIKQKEEIGPYFVIAPRIAMPHTRPEHGAKALGLSIVKLGQAVEFNSEDNDPVDILITMAAVDATTHQEVGIMQIVNLFDDEANFDRLRACRSEQEVLDLIKNATAAAV